MQRLLITWLSRMTSDQRVTAATKTDAAEMRKIWNQREVPVIIRRPDKEKRHRVRLPPSDKAGETWLRGDRRLYPQWIVSLRCWEIPKAWFNDFVNRSLERYGKVYVIQPYKEQEKCDRRCLEAKGHECQCSCMGANHGAGDDGSWFFVSDTFACRWTEGYFACRLMEKKTSSNAPVDGGRSHSEQKWVSSRMKQSGQRRTG